MGTPGGAVSALERWAVPGLFWVALLAAAAAVFTLAGGTGAFDVGPLQVSVRNPTNPLIGATIFAALGVWLVGSRTFLAPAARLDVVVRRYAWALALAIAVTVLWASVALGSFVAGSADASGYLNEARLWARGNLHLEPRMRAPVAFEYGVQPLAPLGFRASASGDTLVPTYPPGLPVAMAAFTRVAGEGAQFLVVPLAAFVLTWLAFLLGRELGGPLAGLLASAMTATSPTVLFQSLQPMSDVPAACALTLALLLLIRPSVGAALGAGVAAAAASLIRPNLFAMVPLLVLATWWWEPTRHRSLARTAAFVLPPALVALAFSAWQRQLYGGLTETGYGPVESLFALQHIGPNLRRYPVWLFDLHGLVLLLAPLAPVLLGRGAAAPAIERGRAVRVGWSALALFGALQAFYLLYPPFDSWAFLRFLLPALPALFALVGVAVVGLTARLSTPVGVIVWLLLLIGISTGELSRGREVGVFQLQRTEHRYVEVADFASEQPEPSLFVTLQHSGSLAYYTARPILRWDWVSPPEIDRALEQFEASRVTVYLVLDDWEEPQFRSRFSGSRLAARLDAPVFTARIDTTVRTSVYLVTAPVSSRLSGS
jgi:Dolichyl-phosphate-mannose-protein mannosyltransferase